jgi:hypothetical protein
MQVMFPMSEHDEAIEWDHEHKYSVPKLRVWYERTVTGEMNASPKYAEVDVKEPLFRLLRREDLVVPGYPCFFVTSAGSDYEKQFLGEAAYLK